MAHDWVLWAKQHRLPYVIRQYYVENIASIASYRKAGHTDFRQIGNLGYGITFPTKWAMSLKYILLGLIWCHSKVRRGDA